MRDQIYHTHIKKPHLKWGRQINSQLLGNSINHWWKT